MAAIDSVDLVTQFEEDTPLQLIDLLKPDYLIKGADYTSQQSSARIWSAHMEARSFWFRSNGAPARHRSSRQRRGGMMLIG
jgi:bifunctional ADP-heptose synthase (sugar kinase/adenylyltransferase)